MEQNRADSFLNRARKGIRNLNKFIINSASSSPLKGFDMEQLIDMKDFVGSREEYIYDNFIARAMPGSWDSMYKSDIQTSLKVYKDTINVDLTRHIRYLDYDMMELMTPEVGTALNIYADYIVQKDPRTGNYLNMIKEFSQIQISESQIQALQLEVNVLADRWGINDGTFMWQAVRDTLKYGDNFLWLILEYRKDENGHLIPVGIKDIQRVLPYAVSILTDPHNYNAVQGYHYKPEAMRTLYNRHMASGGMYTGEVSIMPKDTDNASDIGEIEQVLAPIEMIHLSINKGVYAPYGTSILEGGRKTWKQLLMLEDADVYWSLREGTTRRVFYIDTGRMPPNKAEEYVRKIRTMFRKKPYVEPQGDWQDPSNWSFNMLSQDEDFWIPLPTDSQTKIEQLPVGTNDSIKESIERLYNKLFSKLQVPKAFLTYESEINAKATLLTEDSAFAKTIYRYQTTFSDLFWEAFKIQYYLMGDVDNIIGVKASIVSIDTKVEKEFLENFEKRLQIASAAMGLVDPNTDTLLVPIEYTMRTILDMPEKQVAKVLEEVEEKKQKQELGAEITSDKPDAHSRSSISIPSMSFKSKPNERPDISPSATEEIPTIEPVESPTAPETSVAPVVPEETPAFEGVQIQRGKDFLTENYKRYAKENSEIIKKYLYEKELHPPVSVFVNKKPVSVL